MTWIYRRANTVFQIGSQYSQWYYSVCFEINLLSVIFPYFQKPNDMEEIRKWHEMSIRCLFYSGTKIPQNILAFIDHDSLMCVSFIYTLPSAKTAADKQHRKVNTGKNCWQTKHSLKRITSMKVSADELLFHIVSRCLSELTKFASNKVWKWFIPLTGAEFSLQLEKQQPHSFVVPCKGLCGRVDLEMHNLATSHWWRVNFSSAM